MDPGLKGCQYLLGTLPSWISLTEREKMEVSSCRKPTNSSWSTSNTTPQRRTKKHLETAS